MILGSVFLALGGLAALPNVLAPLVLRREIRRTEAALKLFDKARSEAGAPMFADKEGRYCDFIRRILEDSPLLLSCAMADLVDPYALPDRSTEKDHEFVKFVKHQGWTANALVTVTISHDIVAFYGRPFSVRRLRRYVGAILILRVCRVPEDRITTVDVQRAVRIMEAVTRSRNKVNDAVEHGHALRA